MTAGREPVIVGAALVAGHDGQAEVAIDVRYGNGVVRTAVYSYAAIATALDAAGVARLEELVGRPWTVLVSPAGTGPAPRSEGTPCSI